MNSYRGCMAVFKRELKSYFESPVAYVFLIVFLLLIGSLTFFWPSFRLYERGIADLQPFFFWLPIVYLLLVPAATMGLWAEERRTGTIELLLTMPITMLQAILGKFFAAWAFMVIGILLTTPVVFTVLFLGNPDVGVIIAGYIGAILLAGAYVSVGMLTSAMTRSQVIGFVLSLTFCFVLVTAGTPFITDLFTRSDFTWLLDLVASLSLWSHFQSIQRGVIDLRDVLYYASMIVFMTAATYFVLDNRKKA